MSWMNDEDTSFPWRVQEALLKILDEQPRPKPAPANNWKEMQDERGDHFDYELYDHGDTVVIYPVCDAALHWLYKHRPENNPRWGAKGFVIDSSIIDRVTQDMWRDGLISEEEFEANMNELQQQYRMMNEVGR
jgi:hypothetical protein